METAGRFGWSSQRVLDAYNKARTSTGKIKFQAVADNGQLVEVSGEVIRKPKYTLFLVTWSDGHTTAWYD